MNILVLILGVFLYVLGLWQLDHFVAPFIWSIKGEKIEIATLPLIGDITLEVTRFYVLCFIGNFVGWLLALIWFAV